MLRFKLDENLPMELVELIRSAGMDASHVVNQRLGGQPDRRIAEACRAENRVVVTLDLDFADMRVFPPER